MSERSLVKRAFPHVFLALAVFILAFPIWLVLVASTHTLQEILNAPMPVLPGSRFLENYGKALFTGTGNLGTGAWIMMMNSFIMAVGISVGKIVVSLLAAFAIVFFKFKLRGFCFWSIFVTLMLPVEVRIMPTYKVIADLHMLNTYWGLILPMIVSATAVFLFRQFFLTLPREMAEAAHIDGAGPMTFFRRILIPMTRTPIAAMFVIQFIYGWNQYLWPLLITTKEKYYTLLIGINRMLAGADTQIEWQLVMATTLLAMIPPVIVVVAMQKQFVTGMTDVEK